MLALDGRAQLAQLLALLLFGFLGLDAIIAAVWNALKWVADKAAIVAIAVAKSVKAAAKYTWTGLKWFGNKARDAAFWLKDKASDFASWWKHKAAPWLMNALRKIDLWFHKHFGWLFRFIKILQNTLGWIYKNILRPLLIFLDGTRLVLRLLAALGVEWAKRLEQFLAKVENKIVNTFLKVTEFVNSIAAFLQYFFDNNGAIKRKFILWSQWTWIQDVAILFQVARVKTDPWPEAIRLSEGKWILDYQHRAELLQRDLENPPAWIRMGGERFSELLRV